jgi:single-stranded DNA-binding protein
MPLINELRISGRVATEPTQQGKGPTKFRLAHGGGGKRKDGTPWPVQFFSVSVWHESCLEGLAKGRNVEIFGKLRDASYVAKDGTVRSAVEIVAESIQVEASESVPAPITPNIHGVVIEDSEIPW